MTTLHHLPFTVFHFLVEYIRGCFIQGQGYKGPFLQVAENFICQGEHNILKSYVFL
jgi:hypothetical protein